jgi:signal transduction histidine kinase
MSSSFLRTYLLLAIAAIVAVLATHLVIARQTRRVLDDRIEQMLQAPAEVLRERFEHRGPRGSGAMRPAGRGPRGDRPPIDVVAINTLDLSQGELARFDAGDIVTRRGGGMRQSFYRLDDETALVFGPVPEGLPQRALRLQLATLLLMLVAMGVVLWRLQRPLDRRLKQLADATARFGSADLSARSGVSGRDPVGQLGERFDGMAEQIAALVARREDLLRSVSHELRTPLSRLVLLHEQLDERLVDINDRRTLERMQASLGEMNTLIGELLEFARLEAAGVSGDVTSTDIVDLVREEVALLEQSGATVEIDASGPVVARVDSRLLARAVSNLLRNAKRHASARVVVRVKQNAHAVAIDVDDDGPGVPAADRVRVFEPFVRLGDAPRRGGTGLGLAIARRCVVANGGAIECDSSPLGGARFRIMLPTPTERATETEPNV